MLCRNLKDVLLSSARQYRGRDILKKETKDQHKHMRTGAPTCSVMSVAPKEILTCAALALNEQLGHDKMAVNR